MVAIFAVAILALGIAAWGVTSAFVARMTTWKPRARTVTVVGAARDHVELAPGRYAQEPGRMTLVWGDGSAHVGAPVRHEGRIIRPVIRSTAPIPQAVVDVTPDPGATPDVAGDYTDVSIPTPVGEMPGWLYGDEGDSWAIHVHGVRSNRMNTLWGVPPAREAGYRSLSIAYRGAPDGRAARCRAGMGAVEVEDVVSAIAYAAERGASKILLFGWSMGASAALLATERSPHRDLISGLVLVAPAVSWRHIMRAGARRMRLPGWVSRVVEAAVQTPIVARAVGMPTYVDLDDLDWLAPGRLTRPTLIFGSRGDTNVPFALLEEFAAGNPGHVALHEVAACTHGWEPNVDPDRYEATVAAWIREVAPARR
ncbi:alpha/beta hydrolase [Microbacterium sorbitolivorans]|uniref:Alpha/beta fold hydrolase n=1 Tax=Microbacterium sorbitolivorans TaxID=1867410 RepID=A0A367Y7G7_9MICO|nr:alpha/beta fold hydrolase [Microbacterium sorbitolivorans]RCK61560.1 alpha/beta fold hydrolase [Microbacterium sorbitolivorans]GGF31098.1 alpha/beta hydrolase [Microbacterium sorbitolivorans]